MWVECQPEESNFGTSKEEEEDEGEEEEEEEEEKKKKKQNRKKQKSSLRLLLLLQAEAADAFRRSGHDRAKLLNLRLKLSKTVSCRLLPISEFIWINLVQRCLRNSHPFPVWG